MPTRHTQPITHQPQQWQQPPVGPLSMPVDHEPWGSPAPAYQESVLDHWRSPDDEVSDWQAAWEGGQGEPDPRIGRPKRTGSLFALLLAVVAVAATRPAVAVALVLVWCWLARTADRSVTSLVLRRHTRGRRRSDVPLAVVASPWHLLVGALATLAGLVLPLLVGISGVFSAALATVAVTGGSPEPNAAAPIAVGALLAVLVAWWGPGGSALRRGTRSVVRGVAPGRGSHVVVAGALLVAAGLGTWSYARHGTPVWWPWNTPAEIWQSGLGLRR